nr:MAG TPA_asm: hypothetical protein [Caudoviricetes sp.]DAO21217.1 MAG TPA: hypothetical protein [Caudoviricetes sp.]
MDSSQNRLDTVNNCALTLAPDGPHLEKHRNVSYW